MKSNLIEFHDPHSRYKTRVARPGKLCLNPEKRGPYRSKPELQYSQKTGLLCSINISASFIATCLKSLKIAAADKGVGEMVVVGEVVATAFSQVG